MIKLFGFVLLLLFSGYSLSDARTVVDEDFYGIWSTASSSFHTKRQILELSSNGGRWIQRSDEGVDTVLILNQSAISINGDILTIDYKSQEKGVRLKLILGGWAVGKDKKIFGTVYLYSDRGAGSALYNGIPMSFESGTEHLPPQAFWSFFSGPAVERVEPSSVLELEKQLGEVEGVTISEGAEENVYFLKRIGASIFVTRPNSAAYPSAVGMWLSPGIRDSLETAALYAGDEEAFKKYYASFMGELETQKRDAAQYLEELVEQIEVNTSSR